MGRFHEFISSVFFWPTWVTALMLCLSTTAVGDSPPVIIDVVLGEPVPLDTMLDDLATVRVIYVGEIHSISRHHRIQRDLLRRMAEKGINLALGLEMFTEDQQPVLDRWQATQESFAHLIRDLGNEKWTNLKDYELLIAAARQLKIPIVGLNASDSLVRKVAREGVQGLTESERKRLPDGFDRINPEHDRLLRLRLKVHRAFQDKSLERIVLAQALRDATMACAAARFLDSSVGQDRTFVIVAGAGHVNYGFGIPDPLSRIKKEPFRIILITESGELVLSEAEKRQSVPVEITHQDLRFIRAPIADYLLLTPLKPSQQPPANDFSLNN